MARNQSTEESENTFGLAKLVATCHYEAIDVNFSPANRYASNDLRSNNLFESIVPRYNHDRSYFTPAFCLSADQVPMELCRIII